MDKSFDYEIYSNRDVMLHFELEPAPLRQKIVLHSRILKLSSAESKYSYVELGATLSESGQLSKSIFHLKRSAAIYPHITKLQIKFANALLKLERDHECLDALKKALPFSPDIAPLHMTLIEALEKNNRLEELESLTKEIADMITDPASVQEFYIMNAEMLIYSNKYPQALISYKRAIETNSTMKEYDHYNYGLALYHEGIFEEAIVQFEHSWRLNQKEKNAFNNIVHLNYCLGRFEKAFEGFEYVIENGFEVRYTYSNHILMLYHLDQDEETIIKYKGLLQPEIQADRMGLLSLYQEELRITQAILEKDDVDEKTKEFNLKKIKGINLVLSFINEKANSDEENKTDLIHNDF